MGLSRLDNFLKSARGTILYVDPNSLDSTDSIENTGNSLTRPFKTIQRALIEAARFSYQRGVDNDRFNKTTILLYPGDHLVDNRPGYIPTGVGLFSSRSGQTNLNDLGEWDLDTDFDITSSTNNLYKLNSIYGGVIVPRGTSIVGLDLRKTKIRPTFVPDPVNDNIGRSAIFRVTGGCYFWQFTILDADPNGICYKDFTTNVFVPNFSHHKVTGFEYADGANGVEINDTFLNGNKAISTTRTDLDMYYEKIAHVYGNASGRTISPNYGSGVVDIQPVVDEYRIVGSKGQLVGINSIRSGNGVTPTNVITVNLSEPIDGLSVDTPIQISGVNDSGYDGQYVVSTVSSDTQITYRVQNPPSNPLPGVSGSNLSLVVDTVTSASPYIFNISLRSVYGMCGLLADGDKATGFKSMVVAQYTAIGLQKDNNAFVLYDSATAQYKDSQFIANLHTNSRSRYKPSYENFHVKATNDAFLQLVSVFGIGYAQHFVAENGGDLAINNSNSNFGAKALVSSGFKRYSFEQDDFGYITHIIPPKQIQTNESPIEFVSLDVGITTSASSGAATTTSLYLYNQSNVDLPPNSFIDGYCFGAKENETLSVEIVQSGISSTYSSRIVMPDGPYASSNTSGEKVFNVGRSSVGINSISSNTLTLTGSHSFINGESIRIISDNAVLPDGIKPNKIYYAITKEVFPTLGTNQIRIAQTLSDAINGSISSNALTINNKGGSLKIVSRVSDKISGDIGHPIQWDSSRSQWYLKVSSTGNAIYSSILQLGVNVIGDATTRTYITRRADDRSLVDTLYRVRYVIPKDSPINARPPIDGYILQESNNILGFQSTEISQLYNDSGAITNSTQLRNPRFIANAISSSGIATITTEIPHNLKVGDQVEILNVTPSSYNGDYIISSIPSAKEFSFSINETSFGNLTNNTSVRDQSLPYFKRKKYNKTYQVYRTQEIQEYIPNTQDGIYYLTLTNQSNNPTISPFEQQSFGQPILNLYPQSNKDNPSSDPNASVSYTLPDPLGEVILDDPQNSITKETIEFLSVGIGITNIRSSSGTAHTIYTSIDHGLSGITSVSIVSGGNAYGTAGPGDYYNARLVGFAGSTTGSNATAKITLGVGGNVTSVKIMDGGSAYGIGNTLRVVGIATTLGFVEAVVRVQNITDNINDTLKISGISSLSNIGYNTLYRISGISTGRSKEINVISSQTLSSFSSVGLTNNSVSKAGYNITGKTIRISTLSYNSSSGIATVGFNTSHGLRIDHKVRIGGANQSVFNGDFIVKKIISLTSLQVYIGVTTSSTSATGTLFGYRPILTSQAGEVIRGSEISSGRISYEYAGITTTLTSSIFTSDPDTTTLSIPNAVTLGFKLGDYLLINSEIFRIKNAVTSNSVSIFRSLFASQRQTHVAGSVVRKIKVNPVELRRNSIIRASGHTFEYLGFGPGNYSTSLPDKQDRVLTSSEKFLSQSTKMDGGIVVYTGMNSDGDFFAGNKKLNSATGKEESYETPIPSIVGEKQVDSTINIVDTQKLFVGSLIKVDGGRDRSLVSEFNGPIILNNKLTSNSEIETNVLYLQGSEQVSRRFTISSSKPTIIGNYGDVVFNSSPKNGENVGWIYTTDNEWIDFSLIGDPLITASSANQVIYKDSLNIPVGSNNLTFDGTTLYANRIRTGFVTTSDAYVSGIITATNANITGTLGATRANVGFLSATNANITGIITAGTLDVNTLIVGGGGGVSGSDIFSKWIKTSVGIHTITNVGVGTTNPTSRLTVTGNVFVSGVVTCTDLNSSSDISLKENVTTIDSALGIVENLRGVKFDWKDTKKTSCGVIAQELEEVVPYLVSGENIKSVNYNGIIGILIEAVKELDKKLEQK